MAELLYHGLTTGAGVQTLGEEYCDILQVTGALHTRVTPGLAGGGCRLALSVVHSIAIAWLDLGSRPYTLPCVLAGPVGTAPGRAQRTLLVLLQTLLKYLGFRP